MGKRWRATAALGSGLVLAALGFAAGSGGVARAASSPPATTLGIWTSAENSGSYSTVSGQSPDVANMYEYWSNSGGINFPASFFQAAYSDGATTPFLEVEPWDGSGSCGGDFPTMTAIGANGSAVQSQAEALGSAIASFGHPVVVTFAHEFNIGGQYPWSAGDCEGTTPAQWISAWDAFRADVNATAGGLAYFMWAPNVDPNGDDTVAAQYWPGASEVDMVGVDGYPAFCGCGGTFADIFGGTFSEIQGLSGEATIAQPRIFISETDLAPLDGSGYESISGFISDMAAAGGDGVLQFQDGTPALTSTQWSELDTALASDIGGGGSGGAAPAVATSAANGVTSSGATLNGTVNPEGESATYQFQYGTSTSYGSVSPASPASAGSGTSAVDESATLSGLSANTTYDYRLTATNSTGTTYGGNQTFTTSSSGGGTCYIRNDASAPPRVEENNTTASSAATASFSPPAGSDVLVQVSIGFDTGQSAGPTVTVTDSNGTAFTASLTSWDGAGEGSYIFSHYYSSAPGSITVTATRAGQLQYAMFSVNTRVLTGTAASQSGAASAVANGYLTTPETTAITPTAVGSDVEVVTTEAGTPNLTASGLTTDSSWYSANDGEATASGHVKTQQLTQETVGWNPASDTDWALSALEVLPATNC